jgi:hypothetical protein
MRSTAEELARVFAFVIAAYLVLLSITRPLFAQTTVGTGSIVGTVSDPSSAVVGGANVTITGVATGQVISFTTNLSGLFNSGALAFCNETPDFGA